MNMFLAPSKETEERRELKERAGERGMEERERERERRRGRGEETRDSRKERDVPNDFRN